MLCRMQPVCFELTENDTSLERILQDGNKVILIGAGLLKYAGHPKGNQQYYNQAPFLKLNLKQTYIPLYLRYYQNKLLYLGDYLLQSVRKRVSFEGFSYFEFTMIRRARNLNVHTLNSITTMNKYCYSALAKQR